MTTAGLSTRLDPVTNLIGRLTGASDDSHMSNVLLIGSHLDTVVNAGRYDGPLGVLIGVELAEMSRSVRLPFAIEVIGFCEEEGIRYVTPFIGSRAITGTLDSALLDRVDARGVPMRSAIESLRNYAPDCVNFIGYDGQQVIGYIEPHIEQGPVLEQEVLPIGIVEAIVGQTRAALRFVGSAGHAGTVPMDLRRDALAGAAEWITRVEAIGKQVPHAVATVAQLEIVPNISKCHIW
jgi:hydantoinase/carbamoylase family amidase